ncbi:hypothetical protein [Pseudomonas vanderleydeniana]|uniref:Phage tail protein n=1 Tax=Pseudomonas vanderleydeniana TaxID=2745495 RepID=A0A9E6PPA4_9PSED|nr:hypothetical protein [Pseudomonas vanderleydeniana]QXI29770.1 hypothetical protein HU752_007380 [Pseudomonas vanderleydeniana]
MARKKQTFLSAKQAESLIAAKIAAMGDKKDTEAKETGIRLHANKLKQDLEESGLDKLNLKGGGLLTPFTNGLKAAIKEQDRLALAAGARKAPKLPTVPKVAVPSTSPVVHKAVIHKAPVTPKVPKVDLETTSQHLAKLEKALDKITLKIGQALLPAFDSIVTALIPLATSFGQFVANNPALVQALAVGALAFTVITAAAIGLATVMGVLASPIGLIAAVVAGAAVVLVLAWKPVMGLINSSMRLITRFLFWIVDGAKAMGAGISSGWKRACASTGKSLDELKTKSAAAWADVKSGVLKKAAEISQGTGKLWGELKTWFASFSPLEYLKGIWGGIKRFFVELWNDVLNGVIRFWGNIKATFDAWSPLQYLSGLWDGAVGYFEGLWNGIGDGVLQFWDSLKAIFAAWSPVTIFETFWTGLTSLIGNLTGGLEALAAPVRNFMSTLFGGDPLEVLRAKFDALPKFFSSLLERLKPFVQPIKDMISSVVGVVSRFFGGGDESTGHFSTTDSDVTRSSALLPGGLTQNANLLVRQTATNNRTQLEGGLTVRFENAPQGLRVDQPQTNQPGLSLTPAVGYRSLSLGGAYGD